MSSWLRAHSCRTAGFKDAFEQGSGSMLAGFWGSRPAGFCEVACYDAAPARVQLRSQDDNRRQQHGMWAEKAGQGFVMKPFSTNRPPSKPPTCMQVMWKRAKQDLPHAQMASVGLMPPRQMGQVVLSRPPARYCCTRRRPLANRASLWQPEVAGTWCLLC